MNNVEFYILALNNWIRFLIALSISVFIYYYLIRKFTNSITDPLWFALFFMIFASADVLFLFLTNSISFQIFLFFIAAQISFWIGFKSNFRNKILFNPVKLKHDKYLIRYVYIASTLLYSCSIAITFSLKGIPLLMENRLDTFSYGSGFGVFNRIIQISSIISLYLSFYYLKYKPKSNYRYLIYIYISLYLISVFLLGAKAAFLPVIFTYYAFLISNNGHWTSTRLFKKQGRKLYFFGALLAIAIIGINNDGDFYEIFVKFFQRLVVNGDIYWMAFPNNTYEIIDNSKPFSSIFKDILGSFRLVDRADIPVHPGFQLKWYFVPQLQDIKIGPNARFEVLGLSYFGFFGGIVFSFILGLFVSFLMYRVPRYLPDSVISKALWACIYINALVLITDPIYGISLLNSILIAVIIIFAPLFFLISIFTMYLISEDKNEIRNRNCYF